MVFFIQLMADVPHDFIEFVILMAGGRSCLVQRDIVNDVRLKGAAVSYRSRMIIGSLRRIHPVRLHLTSVLLVID
jgi:hypothetical protein